MTTQAKPIPEGYHTVTPFLTLKDSRRAIDFYKKAFGAEELYVLPSPDKQGTMHAAIRIGDSILMMADETPEMGCPSARSLGASPVAFYVYVPDADTTFKQAIDAGADNVMDVADTFWGDRCGTLKDPFGYSWTIATHTTDMSQQEIEQAAHNFFTTTGA